MGSKRTRAHDRPTACAWVILVGMMIVPGIALLTKIFPEYYRTWMVLLLTVVVGVAVAMVIYVLPRSPQPPAEAVEAAGAGD